MCALEDCAVLLNEIHQLQTDLPDEERPTKAAVSSMFKRYEEKRRPRQKEASDASALLTRLQAYDGWWKWIVMRWLLPTVGMTFLADMMADLCAGAPKISFLPVRYDQPATYRWKDDPKHIVAQPERPSIYPGDVNNNGVLIDVVSVIIILLLLHFSLSFSAGDIVLSLDADDLLIS